MSDRIDQAIAVWKEWNFDRLLLAIATTVFVLLAIFAYRHLDEVVPALVGSTLAGIGVSVALSFAAIGFGIRWALARGERERGILEQMMRAELEECERGRRADQKRIRWLERQVAKLGGEFPPSNWGDA